MRQRTFYSSPARVDDDYVWDQGAGLPVMLQDMRTPSTGSASTTTYLYGLGLVSETVGSTTHFHLADGLGSTTELVEDDGDVANAYRYDVWGALRSSSGSVANQFDFTGEQADHNANRGLVYLRARHYDPALGRFLSRDSLPIDAPYTYGANSPLNKLDPTGHLAVESRFSFEDTFCTAGTSLQYSFPTNFGRLVGANATIECRGDVPPALLIVHTAFIIVNFQQGTVRVFPDPPGEEGICLASFSCSAVISPLPIKANPGRSSL